MKGRIHSMESMGTLDGPGIRFVLFMQGCILKCKYCHNRDTWDARLGKQVSADEIVKKVLRCKPFMEASGGGITVSGGEPLLQKKLYEAMKTVKSMGFLVGLHTSGVIYDNFVKVLPLLDWVGFDIKQVFNKYYEITQIKNSQVQVLKSFDALINSNIDYEIRTTVDTRYIKYEDILNIAKYLSKNSVKEWTLQKCILRNNNGNINIPFLSDDEISKLEHYIKINIR